MTKLMKVFFSFALALFCCGIVGRAEANAAEWGVDAFVREAKIEGLCWPNDYELNICQSYHTENGYDETQCDPADFMRNMQAAIRIAGEKERVEAMHAVLSALGFARDEWAERYIGQMTSVKLIEYGQVQAIEGEVLISVVDLGSSQNHFYYVFIQRSSDWYLTDRFMMDYWALDEVYPSLQLMRHAKGKPGAWFQVCDILHGTGIYADCRHWYNVFARQYDFSYVLEGYDVNGTAESVRYYAGWRTALGFTAEEVGDELRFITYEGFTKHPLEEEVEFGEEVESSMILYAYRYDAQTTSYIRTRAERRPLMNPGAVDIARILYGGY